MIRLNDILTQVKTYHPDPDLDVIKKAYVYSAKVHQGQLRHSGEPYLVPPLEVAGILADLKLDEASIVTGLLHDTIEDTLATPDELTELFGPEVTQLVDGVTKLSKFQASATLSQEEKQAENFRKMIIAMAQDIRVILVKLADRTHNMVRPELAAVLDGRSVALFIRSNTSLGWRAFVQLALISRKPHVALFVGANCPRGVCDLMRFETASFPSSRFSGFNWDRCSQAR